MSFNLPDITREIEAKKFKTHLIDKVVLRVDFADIFSSDALASKMVAKLGKKYSERQNYLEQVFNIDNSNGTVVQGTAANSSVLVDPQSGNFIKINRTFIAFEFKEYTNFENFMETVDSVFEEYETTYNNNPLKRIGLRKINFFDHSEGMELFTFDGYFNKFLTAHLKDKMLDATLTEDRHVLVSSAPPYNSVLRYGTLKGQKADVPHRRFYLDIDCSIEGDIQSDARHGQIVAINEEIFKIFYWSLGEKMLKELANDKKA